MKTTLAIFLLAAYQAISAAVVTLAWDASPDQSWIDGYSVLYGHSSGNYTNRVPVGTNCQATLTLTNNAPGVAYYFVVVAEWQGIDSEYSNELAFWPWPRPRPVSSLRAQ